MFCDHMVVQQQKPVMVWGKAAPKAKVQVTLASRSASVRADETGAWKVALEPMTAGGPYDLTIKSRRATAVIHDVLVGEVWVCSGQSNMEWPVSLVNNAEKEIAEANHPEVRLFTVAKKVSGEPLDGCSGSWALCSPETVKDFSAVGYFFGRRLNEILKVPVGLIDSSWGGTPAEAWTSRPTLEADPDLDVIVKRWDDTIAKYPEAKKQYDAALAEWQKAADEAKAKGEAEPKKPGEPAGPAHPHRTSGLYNGMIKPLIPYGIRGAIWYQGESNAGRAYQYRKLFPAMIQDWRKNWGSDEFPFLFVQLANFMERNPDANAPSAWAELREAQSMTLSLANTGQAVIIDIGEAKDIHPRNKQDVGARLTQAAWEIVYHLEGAVYSGPTYESMRVDGNKVHVKFKNTFGGLMANGGEPVRGFAVAGEDKKFVWANTKIEGDEVVVWADDVAKPVAVRYGWGDNPDCTLYNKPGLPASPFRTDTWPGITIEAK
ncbi:MAG: sialate O-acetylesterase [Candidatus Hydrogenedentes bacterium]|nr:sialate O-acetylesterase [Candidatus Hydrogenedentota bacterium]